ncbi:MAG: 16S rRNA (guanine(966)-N(2))-methyltransferase RsmD [Acidimicrobiia bacterium]
MRIITGSARGRPLVVPKGDRVRPTADRVREALFSALGPGRCVGAHVLDLYAGSGALGLEAASRGAHACVLIERDSAACAAITTNIERTGVHARLQRADVANALGAPAPPEAPFDLVFADPPYELAPGAIVDVLVALRHPGWCVADAVVVVETAADTALELPEGWRAIWERRFGSTLITFVEQES